MILDKAAAAFKTTFDAIDIKKDQIKLNGNAEDTYNVVLHDGVVFQTGLTLPEATDIANREAGRAAVVAVLREIISPTALKAAAHFAGLTITKYQNNELNHGRSPHLSLIEGLLTVLEKDAENAQSG